MKRLYTLLLILVFTLAATGSAFAQEETCGDLSADDCTLVHESLDAMNLVSSGSGSFSIELDVQDAPLYGDLAFGLNATNDFSYSEDALSLAMEIEDMSASELADLYANPDELTSVMQDLLAGMTSRISINATLSEQLASVIAASAGAQQIPSEFALNLATEGGILYIDLSTLGPLLEDATGGMPLTGWVGLPIEPLLEQSMQGAAADPATAGAVAASVNSDIGAGPIYGQLAAADPTGSLIQFFDIERSDDVDVDGTAAAEFSTTVNWDTLLDSPILRQVVYASMVQSGQTLTAEELDQVTEFVRQWAPAILENVSVELVERVAVDNAYLLESDLVVDVDLAGLADAGLLTGTSESSMASLHVVTTNSSLNEDVEVEIPTGAFVLPEEMLNDALQSGQMPLN